MYTKKINTKRIFNENTLKNPDGLFKVICMYGIKCYNFSYEEFYDIYRYRHLITPEVVSKNLNLLQEVITSGDFYNFIRALDEFELLKVIFPSIHALKGIDGGHYHDEEVFTHVLGAVRALDPIDLPFEIKLASLYHDCGKAKFEDFDDGRRRFTNHAGFGAQLVEGDLRRLKFPTGVITTVKTLVANHMQQVDGKKSIFKLKRRLDEHKIPFKYFMWVRYSDNRGSMKAKTNFIYYWRLYRTCLETLYPKHVPDINDLVVTGDMLMSILNKPAGRWIGIFKKKAFNMWQEGEIDNNETDLVNLAKEMEANGDFV